MAESQSDQPSNAHARVGSCQDGWQDLARLAFGHGAKAGEDAIEFGLFIAVLPEPAVDRACGGRQR